MSKNKKIVFALAGLLLLFLCYSVQVAQKTETRRETIKAIQKQKVESAEKIKIVSWKWYADKDFGSNGAIIYNVEVENISDDYIQIVKINFTSYDKSGKICASDFAFINAIAPHSKKSTKAYADYYGTEENAKISIEVP